MAEQGAPEVLVERDGAVATIVLNRPDRYNALTTSLRFALQRVLAELAADAAVRAVVLTGAGKAFCSGQDLREFPDGLPADVDVAIREQYNPIVTTLATMSKPVIAAINGPCAGAGLGIALACDLRLIADEAFLSCAFVGIGLVPDCGTSSFLVELVGYQRAFEIAASGRRVPAAEARDLGLVLETAPAGELRDRVATIAGLLAAGPTRALGLTKAVFRAALAESFDQVLEREALAQVEAVATADHDEGVRAFLEKRAPVFIGS